MKSSTPVKDDSRLNPGAKRNLARIAWLLIGFVLSSGSLAAQPASEKRRTVIVVEQQAARVGFYDSRSGSKLGDVAVDLMPHEVAVSEDGKTAYVSNFGLEDYDTTIGVPGNSISVIDIPKMIEKRRFLTDEPRAELRDRVLAGKTKAPHGLKLRPPRENELFVNVEVGDSMLVYNVKSGRVVRSFPLPPGTHNFIFSSDGERLWLIAAASGVMRVNPQTGEILQRMKLDTPVRGLTFTIDKQFLIASGKNEIVLLDPAKLTVSKHFKELGVGQIIYSEPTPDGRHILAPAPYDSQVLVLDIASGRVVRRLKTGRAPIAVKVSDADGVAYVSNAQDDHISAIDLTTFAVRVFAPARGSNRIEISDFFLRPRS